MTRERHPKVAERLAATLEGHPDTPYLGEAAAQPEASGASSDSNHLRGQQWQQAPDPRHENQKIMSPGVSVQVGNTSLPTDGGSSESLCAVPWRTWGRTAFSRVAPSVLPRRSASALQGFAPLTPWFAFLSDFANLPVWPST